jgi:hypothetical protein
MAKDENKKPIEIKPYSTSELSNFYGISRRTFHRWMRHVASEVGTRMGRFYTIAQVKVIFEIFGNPNETRQLE